MEATLVFYLVPCQTSSLMALWTIAPDYCMTFVPSRPLWSCHIVHATISFPLQVRAFKVDTHNPERWVKYEILYHYQVQMFPDLSID